MNRGVMVHNFEGPPEERTIFLGDLSVYCTEEDIFNFFSAFGAIEKIRIKHAVNNKNLSYGFVTCASKDVALRVLQTMNGKVFLGRALRLGWAAHKSQLAPSQLVRPTDVTPTAQIHVSFLSKQTEILITETTLRSLFGRFGEVADIAIKKIQFNPRLKIQNGYGFIHFPLTKEGIIAAIEATNLIRQYTIDRVTYDSCLTRSLEIVIQTQYHPGELPAVVPYPEHANYVNRDYNNLSTYNNPSPPSSVFNMSSLTSSLPVDQFSPRSRPSETYSYSMAVPPPPAQHSAIPQTSGKFSSYYGESSNASYYPAVAPSRAPVIPQQTGYPNARPYMSNLEAPKSEGSRLSFEGKDGDTFGSYGDGNIHSRTDFKSSPPSYPLEENQVYQSNSSGNMLQSSFGERTNNNSSYIITGPSAMPTSFPMSSMRTMDDVSPRERSSPPTSSYRQDITESVNFRQENNFNSSSI